MDLKNQRIAVVIPAYRCEKHISKVIAGIPGFVEFIIVVDDCSPDRTAETVHAFMARNKRIHLVQHETNSGVGSAVLDGYNLAIRLGAQIIVKLDSDDQMDPAYIEQLVRPILLGQADYTKGNRFLHTTQLQSMPLIRRIGNAGLSFLTKLSSGCWHIFDPNNGYTAIHASVAQLLGESHIHHRYFFESSMLIELHLMKAVVKDIYIPARYGDEVSSLSEVDSLLRFPWLLFKGFFRRITVEYFVQDFTPISLFLITGIPLLLFGLGFGMYHWAESIIQNHPATTGTVMVATLPFILGVQLLLQSFVMDINNTPSKPIHPSEMERKMAEENSDGSQIGCGDAFSVSTGPTDAVDTEKLEDN